MARFEAVLFDLDGTLCHRTQDTDAMYEAVFERVGEPPFGEPTALWTALEGPPDHDDTIGYFGAGFTRVAAQHGRSDVDPLALARALIEVIDDRAVTFCPGAEAALKRAIANGPVGVITNGPKDRQRVKLDVLGITDQLDTVVYAADLSRSKPHTTPFDQAIEDLGVARERTLYVGNSLGYDVAGAQNAGLVAVWVCGDEDVGAYEPDYVIESLAELPALLDEEI